MEHRQEKPLYCDKCLPTFRSALSVCFDCEHYLCPDCADNGHSGHLIYSIDDNDSPSRRDSFCTQMLNRIENEGNLKRERFMQEKYRYIVINRIDIKHVGLGLECVRTMCVTNDGQTCVLTSVFSSNIVIYNMSNNSVLKRSIRLTEQPYGVTEVQEEYHSPSVIAVTFPRERQIVVMDIQCKPARIIDAIDVHHECYDIGYCNRTYVLVCTDNVNQMCFIEIIDKGGGVIQRIYPDALEAVSGSFIYNPRQRLYGNHLAIHQESETIYFINHSNELLSCNMTGRVLNRSGMSIGSDMSSICVDSAQNVYVLEYFGFLRKLSGDLRVYEDITSEGFKNIAKCSMFVYKDTVFILDVFTETITLLRHV